MTPNRTEKQVHEQLAKLLDDTLGAGWRTSKDIYKSIEGAVEAAAKKTGTDEVRKLLRKHRELMKSRVARPAPPPEVYLGRKYAEEGYAEEEKISAAVFDNSSSGAAMLAERRDQIGRELPCDDSEIDEDGDDSDTEHRGAAPGRSDDSLHYPDRQPPAGAWTTSKLVWNPTAPRDGGCIKC